MLPCDKAATARALRLMQESNNVSSVSGEVSGEAIVLIGPRVVPCVLTTLACIALGGVLRAPHAAARHQFGIPGRQASSDAQRVGGTVAGAAALSLREGTQL